MHQSWSPRWRGQRCRPVAEQILALHFDDTLRSWLTTAMPAPSEPLTRIWYRGDQPMATCQLRFVHAAESATALQLSSQIGKATSTETVLIDWTAQRLGGHRAWWKCPGCQRRCGVLFNPTGRQWRCRICAKITYSSSNASDRRVSAALGKPDLAEALGALSNNTDISSLILCHKATRILRLRARRAYRRWFRHTYPHRHLPKTLRTEDS